MSEPNLLDTIDGEFNPNILENLNVKEKVKEFVDNINSSQTKLEDQYKMVAAVTAELFYIKACVNCMAKYDPVAARANIYLAIIAYDLYTTAMIIIRQEGNGNSKQKRENQDTLTVQPRKKGFFAIFLSTFKGKKAKEVNDKQGEVDRLQATTKRMVHITQKRQISVKKRLEDKNPSISEEEIKYLKDQSCSIEFFVSEALKLFDSASEEVAAESAIDKLDLFADKVIFPFAVQCNVQAKEFYESLQSPNYLLYEVKIFSRIVAVDQFKDRSPEAAEGGDMLDQIANKWTEDLFQLMITYQNLLQGDERGLFSLRKFREVYGNEPGSNLKVSEMLIEGGAKFTSPFLELNFMFKLTDAKVFNCFHPKKISKKSADYLRIVVNKAPGRKLDTKKLILIFNGKSPANDSQQNAVSFEKFLGRNLYHHFTE